MVLVKCEFDASPLQIEDVKKKAQHTISQLETVQERVSRFEAEAKDCQQSLAVCEQGVNKVRECIMGKVRAEPWKLVKQVPDTGCGRQFEAILLLLYRV